MFSLHAEDDTVLFGIPGARPVHYLMLSIPDPEDLPQLPDSTATAEVNGAGYAL